MREIQGVYVFECGKAAPVHLNQRGRRRKKKEKRKRKRKRKRINKVQEK